MSVEGVTVRGYEKEMTWDTKLGTPDVSWETILLDSPCGRIINPKKQSTLLFRAMLCRYSKPGSGSGGSRITPGLGYCK